MKKALCAASTAAVLTIAACAAAGESATNKTSRAALLERLYPGTVEEQYIASILGELRGFDRDGNGLDRHDVAFARAREVTQARAASIGQVLTFDLDDDFQVSRAEVLQFQQGSPAERDRNAQQFLSRFDGNSDGIITLAEAGAVTRDPSTYQRVEELLASDPDKDGILTVPELKTLATEIFRQVDTDSSGQISPPEFKAIEDDIRVAGLARAARRCGLPAVQDNAKLVVFGAYEGEYISSAYVGGPDQETNLINVNIEPGTTPLYVVLTSYESIVWRFSGATDRVQSVLVSSYNTAKPSAATPEQSRQAASLLDLRKMPAAAGVIGIPRQRVVIAAGGCPGYFHEIGSEQAKTAIGTLRGGLNRAPDGVFGSYSAAKISLPSGAVEHTDERLAAVPRGFDATSWREATRYWEGGLAAVTPSTVVARTPVGNYKVLPSQMGVSQLIGSGHLVRVAGDAYRLVKPIPNMLPGMGGAHSMILYVAKGVPVPPGDPVHSCIIPEETGEPTKQSARCPNRM